MSHKIWEIFKKEKFQNRRQYNDNLDVLNLILTIIAAYDSNKNLVDGEIESLFGCDIECNFQIDDEDWLRINSKANHKCDASGFIIDSVFEMVDIFTTTEMPEIDETTTAMIVSSLENFSEDLEEIDTPFVEQLLKTGVLQSEINHLLNSCDLAKCTACKDPLLTEEKIVGITKLSCHC